MNNDENRGIFYILPLAFIIGITPLLVHYKKIPLGEVVASYWVRDYNTDFFSYFKMWAFLIFVLLTFITFYIYLKKKKKLKKTFYYLPVGIYMLMVVVSTVFSECKLTSMSGFPDRYEGMPVLLGYMLVLIFAINLIKNKKQIKFLLVVLLISAVLIGILGFYQFFGLDFFQSHIGKKMILPSSGFDKLTGKLDFEFEERNLIYSTFYNPNYTGSYFVMLFMLTFIMYLFASNREEKVLYGAVNLLMFANLLGSLSRAGILGGIISFLIAGLLLKNEIIKRWRSMFIILLCCGLVFTFMDVYTDGKLRKEFMSFGKETELALKGETAKIEDIKVENGKLIFDTSEQKLRIDFNNSASLVLQDKEGNILPYYESNYKDYIYIRDRQYLDFKFRVLNNKKESKILEIYYGDDQINFVTDLSLDNFFVIGMRSNIYPLQEVKSWGFEGKEKLASKRGYIWSRSLPMLKRTMITGLGPDTYAIYFPQEDCIGKFKAYGNAAKIIDKPHNMYLQIAINTGVISLIVVLIMFAVYFWRSFNIYWKNDFNSWFSRAGIAIFLAFIGYAVAGFFNDSVISVAPVFWTLLGMGIMINLKLRSEGSS